MHKPRGYQNLDQFLISKTLKKGAAMKIKFLYITFNIVLIASFLLLFFTPRIILTPELYADLAPANNLVMAGLLLVLAVLNVIFFANKKTLECLEDENWKGLSIHLHNKIYTQKHISARNVHLLCDSLMLTGEIPAINELCEFIKTEKPAAYQKNLLRFASIYVLQTKTKEARALLEEADRKNAANDWHQWYHAFTYYLEKDFSKTTNELGKIISTLKNPAVTALAIYLLQQLSTVCPADFEKYKTETDKAKNKLLVSYSKKKFHAAAEEEKTQTYCVIVSSLLAQAETAIYG